MIPRSQRTDVKKFDLKKIKWKKIAILAVVILVVALGISELFRLHAEIITVKFVADVETYQSKSTGGYTSAIVSRDKKEVRDWIRLYEEIKRKGTKVETRLLSQAFPSYSMEFRQGSLVVQKLIVTPERVGIFNWLTGSYVLEFEDGNPYYEIVGQRMREYESGK